MPASVQEKKQNVPTALGGGSLHMPSSFDGTRAAGGGGGACEQPTAQRTSKTGPSRISIGVPDDTPVLPSSKEGLFGIAMNRVRRERRQAHSDVLGALRLRAAVANP